MKTSQIRQALIDALAAMEQAVLDGDFIEWKAQKAIAYNLNNDLWADRT